MRKWQRQIGIYGTKYMKKQLLKSGRNSATKAVA